MEQTSLYINFDELFAQAIQGKTSITYFNRGNRLMKLQNKYNRILEGCQTIIDKTSLPYTLVVSWENRFNEIKATFDSLFKELKEDKTLGPYDIVDVCHQIIDDRNTILLFSANIAYNYCKIRIKGPFGSIIKGPFGSIIKAIKKIDDNSSYFYLDNDDIVGRWSAYGRMGKYSYISDKKIAMMLRIAYGFEFEDLTETEKAI